MSLLPISLQDENSSDEDSDAQEQQALAGAGTQSKTALTKDSEPKAGASASTVNEDSQQPAAGTQEAGVAARRSHRRADGWVHVTILLPDSVHVHRIALPVPVGRQRLTPLSFPFYFTHPSCPHPSLCSLHLSSSTSF